MTHYETLQISPKASPEVIEAAWKTLMLQYHPDRKGGSKKKAADINIAHDILSDPKKRELYDLELKANRPVRQKPIVMPQQAPAYPPAYPPPTLDVQAIINRTVEAGKDALQSALVGELEKNPVFKSVLDSLRTKRRTG
jgi:curved DNA-binding protein CbpA